MYPLTKAETSMCLDGHLHLYLAMWLVAIDRQVGECAGLNAL